MVCMVERLLPNVIVNRSMKILEKHLIFREAFVLLLSNLELLWYRMFKNNEGTRKRCVQIATMCDIRLKRENSV